MLTMKDAGVRIVILNNDNLVLAINNDDGYNLPGGSIRKNETDFSAAIRVINKKIGIPKYNLERIFYGKGDKFHFCTVFKVNLHSEMKDIVSGGKLCIVKFVDILCGRWGLFAFDAFSSAGFISRKRLSCKHLYRISRQALNNGENRAIDGVDAVLDEFAFLQKISKISAIDAFLKELDVGLLHPDIADAMLVIAEGIHGLEEIDEFRKQVELRILEVDGPRHVYILRDTLGNVLSNDVRADARKYYRKKAREFGISLRAGTLDVSFKGTHRGSASKN